MNKYQEALKKVLCDNPKAQLTTSDIHSSIALLQELVHKETPAKPIYEGNGYADGHMVYDVAICPNCGTVFHEYDNDGWASDYCPECGQKLDWSEDNESED